MCVCVCVCVCVLRVYCKELVQVIMEAEATRSVVSKLEMQGN